MSAAYLPHNPSSDLLPVPGTAAGGDSATVTAPVRSPDRPIRFPHIPSIDQTPPGMAQYLQRQQQSLRIDSAHTTPTQSPPTQSPAPAPKAPLAERSDTELGKSLLAERSSRAVETHSHNATIVERMAAVPQPTLVRPATPANQDNLRSLSTQVEQIAEYLRRRRNELESEQTDLKLNALMQEAALLQEKEQLRGQQLNIQMVQATLEILRRQLLEFGHALSEAVLPGDSLQSQFEGVCQAYYDVNSVARLLDADQ